MKHSKSIDRESRRNVLKSMALLSGAAVMTTANTSSAEVTTTNELKNEVPPSLGYRETTHVREYYRLARF